MGPIAQQILMMVVGTVIGWLLNGVKARTSQLHEKSRQEEQERRTNRDMIGKLMFLHLEDMYEKFVVDGHECSAADKQQVDDIYDYYHNELGLNGPGTHMYNAIMNAHQS